MRLTRLELASVIAVLSAMALVVLDAGLLNVALPTISQSLNQTPSRTILVVSAYQVTLVIGLLPAAQFAERFGQRKVFTAGVTTFLSASLLCAVAPSLALLVLARAIQGLGGAAIMALGIALLRATLGKERLGSAIGWNALTVAMCTAVAPLLGSAILATLPWQWLFLVKLPIGLVALIAAGSLPKLRPTRATMDLIAMLLHASIAALAFVAAQTAPVRPIFAWMLLGIGIAIATLLVRREHSVSSPLWPVDLLTIKPVRIAVVASICCFAGQSAALLALPFFLELGLGRGPAATALVLTCWPLAVAMTGTFANRLAEHFGAALLCTIGAGIQSIGLLGAALWPSGQSIASLALASTVAGLGFGLFQVPNNRTMFLLVPVDRSAAAGGVQGSARLVGQTLGALLLGFLMAGRSAETAARVGLETASIFTIFAALVSALGLPARLRRIREPSGLNEGRTL